MTFSRTKRTLFTAVGAGIAALALVLAGCSSGASTSDGGSSEAPDSSSSQAADGGDTTADSGGDAADPSRSVTIGIALIAQVETMDIVTQNFKDALAARGYTNVNYIERNAQGNPQTASLIAKQLLGEEPDLIFTIGTPLVMSFLQLNPSIPVVFGAMTDPVGAGVVESLEAPGGDFTGSSDAVSADGVFEVVKALVPDAKNIGLLGNVSEQNTAVQFDAFAAYASANGMTTQVAPVASTANIQLAIKSLAGKVDAIVVGTDNTIAEAIDTAGQAALAAELPLIMAAGMPPTAGLLAAFGADYAKLGGASGGQAADILDGTPVGSVPVVGPEEGGYQVDVNETTAQQLGITIPDQILGITPNIVTK